MVKSMLQGSAAIHLLKVLVILWISACVVPTSADAFPSERNGDTPLSGPHTAIAIVVGVGSLIGLIYALFNCSCCDESSLLKYEETPDDDDAVQVEAEDDFSPPTESTPNEQKSAPSQEAVSNITSPSGTGVDSAALEPYDDPKLQFSRDQLNYVEEMGSGWFGKVLRGEAHQIHPGMRKTRVVVKQLRDSATPDEQVMFAKEVQPYREVNHPNVMMLLGQCLETSPLLLIMEYAPNGDLKAFLQKNKDKTQNFAQDDVQLKMATDVISGLLWLHQADFVHIDLAARNCQVSTDNVIKIGDYGTSLEKYPSDYHMTKDGRHAVPIRWLAPEVINADSDNIEPKKITKQSNIWSFGVIMLELSTGGDSPYPTLSDEEVLQKIVRERQIQVDKPNLAMKYADRWCETMMFCWLDEDNRPTTKEVHDLIHHLKTYKEQLNKDDFNARWDALKPAAVKEASSESSIEVPSPQRKADDGKFESNFVEAEISVTPEEHQMQENPNSQFSDDFAPRAEEETPQKVERGNPFLKDLAEQFAGDMDENKDVNQNQGGDLFHSEAGIAIAGKRGKLDFSVQYNEKKMELQCSIHRAHDLKAMDPNGFSDPYVKLHILPRASSRSTKLRTKTKFKTLNPEFKEELAYHGITPEDLHTKTLRLSVWDEDSLGHNDFIGEYLLPLSKLPLNETKAYSVFLQDQSNEIDDMSEAERGKILLGLQYFRKQGQLRVTIVRCAGLYAMDSNGYSDPYVKLYLQPDPKKKTKQKTGTKKKTLNPEYNETFLYSLPPVDIQAKTLEVTVWDKDVGTNDYIGGVQLGYLAKGDRRQHFIDAIDNPDQLIERWHILSETQFSDDD